VIFAELTCKILS